MKAFDDLTDAVRKGGTVMGEEGHWELENPIWVEFARSMAPMMMMPAEVISKLVGADKGGKCRVLDIAAGHGLFGINIARHNPQAEIVALDWANVLEVAKENARKSGVESRYSTLPGSAFEVEFGAGYDLVLLTNFLHHFDPPTNEGLLRKVHAALAPGGRAVTLEFVPNDDRVTPPEAATFSMIMLGSTPHGDAYTFAEFERMFSNAGFTRSEHFRQAAAAGVGDHFLPIARVRALQQPARLHLARSARRARDGVVLVNSRAESFSTTDRMPDRTPAISTFAKNSTAGRKQAAAKRWRRVTFPSLCPCSR